MKSPLKDRAAGKWYGILSQLGVNQDFLTGKHCACPSCGGKDRFRWADNEGSGNYFCNGCGHGDGADLLMKINGWDFATTAKEVEKVMGEVEFKIPQQKKDPLPRLKQISSEISPLAGKDPASLYLVARGLISAPELRYHPGLRYYDGRELLGTFPAMLAIIQDRDGNNLTYHATYLRNGKKAGVSHPKKIFPPVRPIKGGFIQLFGTGQDICVAEGIETAIAAHEHTGLPCVAAISANGMESIQLPPLVRKVLIFGDNDESFTGQKSAYTLANRLMVRQKIKVEIIIPDRVGEDFADVWARRN